MNILVLFLSNYLAKMKKKKINQIDGITVANAKTADKNIHYTVYMSIYVVILCFCPVFFLLYASTALGSWSS